MTKLTTDTKKTICIRECSLPVSENAAYLYQRIQPTCIRECSLPVSDIAVNWMMALHSFYGISWRIYKPPDFPSDVNIYSFHFSFQLHSPVLTLLKIIFKYFENILFHLHHTLIFFLIIKLLRLFNVSVTLSSSYNSDSFKDFLLPKITTYENFSVNRRCEPVPSAF